MQLHSLCIAEGAGLKSKVITKLYGGTKVRLTGSKNEHVAKRNANAPLDKSEYNDKIKEVRLL